MTRRMARRSRRSRRSPAQSLPSAAILHEGGVEAQLHVGLPAQRLSGGERDADRVLALDALAEQVVLEAERAHEVHGLGQIGARREGDRLLRRVEHLRGLELGVEARRGRCRRASPSLRARPCPCRRCRTSARCVSIPDADQRLAEIGIVLQRLGVHRQRVDDLAGDLAGVEDQRRRPAPPSPPSAADSR